MKFSKNFIRIVIVISVMSVTNAGISPVHDMKEKVMNMKTFGERFLYNSPHKVLKHLDTSILKATKNITQNPDMDETLYKISKDMVSAILSKLEIQDKITKITKEALEAPDRNKGITAIETRRILDYISRSLSGHILTITRASTEPELHRLVYGLAQIAAEVSIISALKDTTYSTALSKKPSVDLSLRKKRSIVSSEADKVSVTPSPQTSSTTLLNIIINKPSQSATLNGTLLPKHDNLNSPFSVISKNLKNPVHVLKGKSLRNEQPRVFLNQTVLDMDSNNLDNDTNAILMDKSNETHYEYIQQDTPTLDTQEKTAPGLIDDWVDTKDNIYKSSLNSDVAGDIEIDQPEFDEDAGNEKRAKQKSQRLETKAKKAIIYAGDVAYLTAASVVALRRALTASIEVQMSVKYAKNGMSNHQDLMMNLAKTAAQQAGKEAKSATSKSLACERVIKLALKYTAQSQGANLNHVANRIVMDTLSLATLAKSMAFVSSDIAMNSLYQATDLKPPS